MNKVNLDLEFEKWREEHEENLKEKFLDIHNFYDYLNEAWQEYQQENNLIDITNENFCNCGNKLVEENELNIGVCKKCQ